MPASRCSISLRETPATIEVMVTGLQDDRRRDYGSLGDKAFLTCVCPGHRHCCSCPIHLLFHEPQVRGVMPEIRWCRGHVTDFSDLCMMPTHRRVCMEAGSSGDACFFRGTRVLLLAIYVAP